MSNQAKPNSVYPHFNNGTVAPAPNPVYLPTAATAKVLISHHNFGQHLQCAACGDLRAPQLVSEVKNSLGFIESLQFWAAEYPAPPNTTCASCKTFTWFYEFEFSSGGFVKCPALTKTLLDLNKDFELCSTPYYRQLPSIIQYGCRVPPAVPTVPAVNAIHHIPPSGMSASSPQQAMQAYWQYSSAGHANMAVPNATNPSFNLPSNNAKDALFSKPPLTEICECGAHKIGVKKGQAGHSTWCPWSK